MKKKQIVPRMTFKVNTPIWDSLPIAISWQLHQKSIDTFSTVEQNLQDISEGINIGILLNMTTMIEGYLEETLRTLFDEEIDTIAINNKAVNRYKTKFGFDLGRATFNSYSDLFSLIIGESLIDIFKRIDSELWKDIKNLFSLRNIATHGQNIELIMDLQGGTKTAAAVEFEGKFNKLLNFLEERNINPNVFPEGTKFKTMFFGDSVIEYFYPKSKEFILSLDKDLKTKGYGGNSRLPVIFKPYTR